MENNNTEKQLDLATLWTAFKKFWLVILIVGIVFAAGVGFWTEYTTIPTYTCTFSYLVNPNPQYQQTSSTAYVAQEYASVFAEIVPARKTIYEAIRNCGAANNLNYQEGGENLVNQVKGCVNARISTSSSRTFIVTITATSPSRAYDIAQTLEDYLPTYLADCSDNAVCVTSVDDALPPVNPNPTHTVRNAVLAGAAGAIVTYLIYLVYLLLNNELTDEDMLTQLNSDIPVLGRIPTWGDPGKKLFRRELKSGFSNKVRHYNDKLLNRETPFAITESFKTLRSNVNYVVGNDGCSVIAATSIRKASGKTVVIANLAVSYAQLGKKVLLIEGDMRIPAFHKLFGLRRGNGLSEILAGIQQDHHSACVASKIHGLDVMLSGQIPPNPSELLSSARMETLLSALRKEYDLILIDLPPFVGLADASVMAPHVDGYLLITRIGYTNLREVKQGVADMKRIGMKIVGFVVNDVSMKGSRYTYYRYGYKRNSYKYEYGANTAELTAPIPLPQESVEAEQVEPPKRKTTKGSKSSS